jgi:hypothetical protein
MTDGSGNYIPLPAATPPAGWYPDPEGTPRRRWWNGAAWTADLHYPEPPVFGRVAPTAVGQDTPVYNAFIWVIVLLPLLSMLYNLTTDTSAMFTGAISTRPGSIYTPVYVLGQFLSLASYAAMVTLAYFDRQRLIADGFVRPFHWAWTFLIPGIYVIGRSVVVRRQAGRGVAPIWVWAVLMVLSVVIAIGQIAVILPLLRTTVGTGLSS